MGSQSKVIIGYLNRYSRKLCSDRLGIRQNILAPGLGAGELAFLIYRQRSLK